MPYVQKLMRVALVSDPSYWVDIYPEVTWATMKQVSQVDDKGNTVYQVDALLLAIIKAWNLDGADGKVLPITAENIDYLKKDDIQKIVEAVGALLEETDDSKKAS